MIIAVGVALSFHTVLVTAYAFGMLCTWLLALKRRIAPPRLGPSKPEGPKAGGPEPGR